MPSAQDRHLSPWRGVRLPVPALDARSTFRTLRGTPRALAPNVKRARRSVLLGGRVDAAVRPSGVAPRVVQLLDEVHVTKKLVTGRLQLRRGGVDVVNPEPEDDAIVEAPRARR